jgi:hypothetical protein
MNNGDILNDIERMASETESLAVNVNNEMTSGTRALINSKKSVPTINITFLVPGIKKQCQESRFNS